MEKLIKIWKERQKHYEDLAEKHKYNEHNCKKFTYKAIATRDCWKELFAEIEVYFCECEWRLKKGEKIEHDNFMTCKHCDKKL